MALPLVPTLVIGGGVGYAVIKARGAAAAPGAQTTGAPAPGSTGSRMSAPGVIAGARVMTSFGALGPSPTWVPTTQPGSGKSIDPELQMALDQGVEEAKQQFQNMSDVEKISAAQTLNDQMKLDPPLNGHEDWDTIAAVVGGAAGAAAGAAICGPLCGKVGALVGAYLGKALYDYLYDKVGKWVSDTWDQITADHHLCAKGTVTWVVVDENGQLAQPNDYFDPDGTGGWVDVTCAATQPVLDPKRASMYSKTKGPHWVPFPTSYDDGSAWIPGKDPIPAGVTIGGTTGSGGSLTLTFGSVPVKSSQQLGVKLTTVAGTARF